VLNRADLNVRASDGPPSIRTDSCDSPDGSSPTLCSCPDSASRTWWLLPAWFEKLSSPCESGPRTKVCTPVIWVLNTEACAAMGRGGGENKRSPLPAFLRLFSAYFKISPKPPPPVSACFSAYFPFLAKFVHKFIGFVVFAKISNFYPRGKCCFFRASFFFFHHPKKNSQNI